jgi:hypothetical protein
MPEVHRFDPLGARVDARFSFASPAVLPFEAAHVPPVSYGLMLLAM